MSLYDHDYSAISEALNVPTIESRHLSYDRMLAFRVLGGHIAAPDLSQLFQTREVNYSLRFTRPLCDDSSRTSFKFNSVVVRVKRRWNQLSSDLADVDSEPNMFKRMVQGKVLQSYVT